MTAEIKREAKKLLKTNGVDFYFDSSLCFNCTALAEDVMAEEHIYNRLEDNPEDCQIVFDVVYDIYNSNESYWVEEWGMCV